MTKKLQILKPFFSHVYVIPAKGPTKFSPSDGTGDPRATHGNRYATPRNQGVRFPLPKNPKIDVPVFNGSGDVLNWLYQLEHLFAIHDAPVEERVEFRVFYLKRGCVDMVEMVAETEGWVCILA